jgi:hypothetical protein
MVQNDGKAAESKAEADKMEEDAARGEARSERNWKGKERGKSSRAKPHSDTLLAHFRSSHDSTAPQAKDPSIPPQ